MALTRKNRVDQFRHELLSQRKPLGHKEFEEMRVRVIEALESTGHIIVQKARRSEHEDAILEVVCNWMSIDASPEAIREGIAEAWPGKDLPDNEEKHFVESRDEAVLLISAASMSGGKFVTAKVLVLV